MKSKIGLILTHFYVNEGENYKWNWIKKTIKNHKKIYNNFHIILSGHGAPPPIKILDKIDTLYWEKKIIQNQIGMGHPFFSIKGYEASVNAGCEYSLKNCAFNWLEHDKILKFKRVFCSTNTNFTKNQLGDLLIFAGSDEMLNLWKCREWDYKLNDGLENLFFNMLTFYGSKEIFKNNTTFLSSRDLGWMTFNDYRGAGPKYWGEKQQKNVLIEKIMFTLKNIVKSKN